MTTDDSMEQMRTRMNQRMEAFRVRRPVEGPARHVAPSSVVQMPVRASEMLTNILASAVRTAAGAADTAEAQAAAAAPTPELAAAAPVVVAPAGARHRRARGRGWQNFQELVYDHEQFVMQMEDEAPVDVEPMPEAVDAAPTAAEQPSGGAAPKAPPEPSNVIDLTAAPAPARARRDDRPLRPDRRSREAPVGASPKLVFGPAMHNG